MSNDRFKNALQRTPQNIPPIWFMRQAGRYHKHYQKLKERYSFMDLCKQPELAAETAFGPIDEFDFDVSILFSDLLFPLEAIGMGLEYNPGPQLGILLSEDTFSQLLSVDEAFPSLLFQGEAVKATRERLPKDKSLIGFVGGPWTLFTYAVEGGHKGNLLTAKSSFKLFQRFNEIMVPLLKKNIELQLNSGAEIVMVFDTAAGELSPLDYKKFVAGPTNELSQSFPKKLGYYSKLTLPDHLMSNMFSEKNWAGFGVDHRWNLPQVLDRHENGFVQGNFDQSLLFQETSDFKKSLDDYLKPFTDMSPSERAGWVSGLGHGILPKTPENHVKYFVERVREVFSESN